MIKNATLWICKLYTFPKLVQDFEFLALFFLCKKCYRF
nr:MAG TPA_asm: hypothetical protein [Caudoviricetes sp.]